MGLDMMLYRKNSSSDNQEDLTEVMYWRKANAIHNWFVENVQDGIDECEPHDVTVDQLKELRDLCYEVLKNPERAENLLPTSSGFFFGSTAYDEWYQNYLKNTVEELNLVLEDATETDTFVYQSSW
jgi:hypothetical protein